MPDTIDVSVHKGHFGRLLQVLNSLPSRADEKSERLNKKTHDHALQVENCVRNLPECQGPKKHPESAQKSLIGTRFRGLGFRGLGLQDCCQDKMRKARRT